MRRNKIIGIITIAVGIFYIIYTSSNIQSLFFSDLNIEKKFPEINYYKQTYTFFKWLAFGILGIFSGYKLLREKKIGWILTCSFWGSILIERLFASILNLLKSNLLFNIQTSLSLIIFLIIVSKFFIVKYEVDKYSWIKVSLITGIIIFSNQVI